MSENMYIRPSKKLTRAHRKLQSLSVDQLSGEKVVTDIYASPSGTRVLSRRVLIGMILLLLSVLIAVFVSSAVRAETQRCNSMFWKFVVYRLNSSLYAKKCGCPNNADFHFACNSQYINVI
jgi:hypothetical protein